MVGALDRSWETKGTYAERRKQMIRQITTVKSKQQGFYRRATDADLYRVSVLTTRIISGQKKTLARTSTFRGPLAGGVSQRAAVHVAKKTLHRLADYATQYSVPYCTVCLGTIGDSTRVVQMTLDACFGGTTTLATARIWVAFRVCSEECGGKASVLD